MKPIFLIIFGFILFFDEVNSKCFNYSYGYEIEKADDKKKIEMCYVFLRPEHIQAFRLDIFKEGLAENDPRASVVDNLEKAQNYCKSLQWLHAQKRPTIKKNTLAGYEFTNLSTITGKRLFKKDGSDGEIKVAELDRNDPKRHLKWLLQRAFSLAQNKSGGRSFLNGGQQKKLSALKNEDRRPGLNNGTDPFIIFDPGRPDLEGFVWVNGTNPYLPDATDDQKCRHLICQYKNPPDCIWEPITTKCEWDYHGGMKNFTNGCVFKNHKKPVDSERHPKLGEKCEDKPHTNVTEKCPEYRHSECDADCTWAEWTEAYNPCHKYTCPHGASKVFSRRIDIKQARNGKDCDLAEKEKRVPCCKRARRVQSDWRICSIIITWLFIIQK